MQHETHSIVWHAQSWYCINQGLFAVWLDAMKCFAIHRNVCISSVVIKATLLSGKREAKSFSLRYVVFGCSLRPCCRFEINLNCLLSRLWRWIISGHTKICNSTVGLLWLLRKEEPDLPQCIRVQLTVMLQIWNKSKIVCCVAGCIEIL